MIQYLCEQTGGPKIAKAIMRMNLHLLRGKPAKETAAPATETAPAASIVQPVGFSFLPKLLEGESYIAALKSENIQYVPDSDQVAAVKGALASYFGLFEVPSKLLKLITDYENRIGRPFGNEYFAVKKILLKKHYAEVFHAMNLDLNAVPQAAFNAFLSRVYTILFPGLESFYNSLLDWNKTWREEAIADAVTMGPAAYNPAMAGRILPAGIGDAPNTNILRASAMSHVEVVNRTFQGESIPAARGIGIEALKVMELLNDTSITSRTGIADRKELLRAMGIKADDMDELMEKNLATFALSISQFKDVPSGDAEIYYLKELVRLGRQIPWDRIRGISEARPNFTLKAKKGVTLNSLEGDGEEA